MKEHEQQRSERQKKPMKKKKKQIETKKKNIKRDMYRVTTRARDRELQLTLPRIFLQHYIQSQYMLYTCMMYMCM